MKVERIVMSGTHLAPRADALDVPLARRRPLHQLQDARAGVLERHVEVRQHLAFGHQRDHVVDVRVRIHVVQPDPRIARLRQLPEFPHQFVHPRLHGAACDEVELVANVDAIGAGVLRDHQQLLHALPDEVLGLAHHLPDGAAHEVAAHRRDDAEAAAMVAALGDLQVGVVPGSQLDPGRRHQVAERVVRPRQVAMDVVEHLARRVRAGDRQDLGMDLRDEVLAARGLRPKAAGDDHLAVLGQRLADRIQRLLHGGIDEAAGVDDDEVGVLVGRAGRVALGAQLRDDQFGVDQRLRAAERNEADGRRRGAPADSCEAAARPTWRSSERQETTSWCRPGNPGSR